MTNEEIKALIDKKTELERKKERLLGKMESAKNALSELDERLIAMNIKPNQLEEEIKKLTDLKDEMLTTLNTEVQEAELSLNRIEQRIKEISQ
jgi:predicted  nucleic acid-binding Zn-ribbon protein